MNVVQAAASLTSARPSEASAPPLGLWCCPPWPIRSPTVRPRWRSAPRSALRPGPAAAPQPPWRRRRTKEAEGSPGRRWTKTRSSRSSQGPHRVRFLSASAAAPSASCAASYETLLAGSWTKPGLKQEFGVSHHFCSSRINISSYLLSKGFWIAPVNGSRTCMTIVEAYLVLSRTKYNRLKLTLQKLFFSCYGSAILKSKKEGLLCDAITAGPYKPCSEWFSGEPCL